VTTPGGVSNLPAEALTLDTLASRLQDMSPSAMRGRAAERFPSIFDGSSGGNPLTDLTPLGILTRIWAEFNSAVANADPADIQGPEDLPNLLLKFIEDLPVVGELVGLLEAILGTYDGDDPVLLQIQDVFGIFRTLFAGLDFTNPSSLDPAEIWHAVVSTFLLPLNLLLGPNSPLPAGNLFGRIQLPQFAGGVPIPFLTTAVPNLLEPFTAVSVPNTDGWSYDAVADAAKVICDGTAKNLYLKSGVIKVEPDQPLNTEIKVKYSGVSSTAGQGIRYVLETFTSADGSGPATPVVIGSIPNPTGTISAPVTLGDSSWDIPAGVQSVRPVLTNDPLASGAVYWLNTPVLKIPPVGVLADGLPAAIQARIDDLNNLLDALLTAPASVLGMLGMDRIAGLLDLKTILETIRDILAGIPTVPSLPVLQDIKDWWTSLGQKTQKLTSAGKLAGGDIIGTVPKTVVEGLVDLGDTVTDSLTGIFNGWFGSGGTGTPAQAQQTIEAIRDAVIAGYNVTTFTSSQTNWARPTVLTEAYAVLVGSGQPSSPPSGKVGGNPGLDGSYLVQPLDVATLPAQLDIAVGTNGARSYVRAATGNHTGTVLAQSPAPGSPGGIATAFGFTPTSSQPGQGGKGGNGQDAINTPNTASTPGEPGTSSTLGAGGLGGTTTSGVGNGGQPGGSVSAGAATKCGGGGGGGGAGGTGALAGVGRAGGPGGPGGWPGGGAGGPGAGSRGSTSNGADGAIAAGGAGAVWLFTR
jgi:hypothetical protein